MDKLVDYCKRGDFYRVQSFLSSAEGLTIDLNARDDHGKTVLWHGLVSRTPSIVKLLLAKGADPDLPFDSNDEEYLTPLMYAVKFDYGFYLLIQNSKQLNAQDVNGWSVAHWIVQQRRSPDLLDELDKRGANLNLFTFDDDIDALESHTPLMVAIVQGYTEHAQRLVELGVNVNVATPENKYTALHYYCEHLGKHPLSLLDSLIRIGGAKVNAADGDKVTPLFECIMVSSGAKQKPRVIGAMQMLIEHGAKLNVRNFRGCTLLHEAISAFVSLDVIRLLLDHGANPSSKAKSPNKETPLLYAIQHGSSVECVQLLLDYGARVNDVDGQKRSPLMCAIMNRCFDLVPVLLQAGAQVNLTDSCGKTVFYYVMLLGDNNNHKTTLLNLLFSCNHEEERKRLLEENPDGVFEKRQRRRHDAIYTTPVERPNSVRWGHYQFSFLN